MAVARTSIFVWTMTATRFVLKAVLEDIHPQSVTITAIEFALPNLLLVGLDDGTVSVWRVALDDASSEHGVHREGSLVCSFSAHRSHGTTKGIARITLDNYNSSYSIPETYPSADANPGHFTFFTCGSDDYVRQWTLSQHQRVIGVWEGDLDSSGDDNASGCTRDTVETFVLAKEIGTFKLQAEPPNHYVETKKEWRKIRQAERKSLNLLVINASLPFCRKRLVLSTIGGLVSIIEVMSGAYHVFSATSRVLSIVGGRHSSNESSTKELFCLASSGEITIFNPQSNSGKPHGTLLPMGAGQNLSMSSKVTSCCAVAAASPEFCAVGFGDGKMQIIGQGTTREISPATGSSITCMVSPFPNKIVACDSEGYLRLWRVGSGGSANSSARSSPVRGSSPARGGSPTRGAALPSAKILWKNQAHAGSVVSMHANEQKYACSCAIGGVAKVWKATQSDLKLIGFFIAKGDISSVCIASVGSDELLVCSGFESGCVQSWNVTKGEVSKVPASSEYYHSSKISQMDEISTESGIIVLSASIDMAVTLFYASKEGLVPFRRLACRFSVLCAKFVKTDGAMGVDVIVADDRRVNRMVAISSDPVTIDKIEDMLGEARRAKDAVADTAAAELPYEAALKSPSEVRRAAIEEHFRQKERDKKRREEAWRLKAIADADQSRPYSSGSRPWSQGPAAVGASSMNAFGDGDFVVGRPLSPSPAAMIPPQIRADTPITEALLKQSQSISLPNLMNADSNDSVASTKSHDVNLSIASVHSSLSGGRSTSLTPTHVNENASKSGRVSSSGGSRPSTTKFLSARQQLLPSPGSKKKKGTKVNRLPDWSKLRREPRLKSAFEGNDVYNTGRIRAESIPSILRWWWPAELNNSEGDNLIAIGMQAMNITFEHNITLAQLAQVAHVIVKEKNDVPPTAIANIDVNGDENVQSRSRKKMKRYEDMNLTATKIVYNEVGERRIVTVNVSGDDAGEVRLGEGSLQRSMTASSQRRFSQIKRLSRTAKSVVPGREEYVPYQTEALFRPASLITVPSSFQAFWQSPLTLTKTRKLNAREGHVDKGRDDNASDEARVEQELTNSVTPPSASNKDGGEKPKTALQSMYGSSKDPEVVTPQPRKKKRVIVQKPRFMDLNKTVRITRQLINLKILADKESILQQVKTLPFAKVIYDYYLQQFGFHKVSEHRLTQLFDAISANAPSSSLLRVFARMLDLYNVEDFGKDDGESALSSPSKLPFDLCDMCLEMLNYCQDRDFVVNGLLVPSEGGGAGGFRGGSKNEVRSLCVSKRHMELCFREVATARGRHFSPGCMVSIGHIIFDLPEIVLFDAVAGTAASSVDGSASLTCSFDVDGSLLSNVSMNINDAAESNESRQDPSLFLNSTSAYADLDSLIDLEDCLELIVQEVERFDRMSASLANEVFSETSVPSRVLRAVSRDISTNSSSCEESRNYENVDLPAWRSSVERSLNKVRSLLTAFVIHDDQRSGCMPIEVFSSICRNGGSGAWEGWGIPPLYAHALQTRAPPGTPGSSLGTNPLKPVEKHPDDDEELCQEELALHAVIKKFFDPIEGNVCFLDFVIAVYSSVLDSGKLSTFSGLLEQIENPTRGLERDVVDAIVDFTRTLRLVEGHAMFNVQGISIEDSMSLMIEGGSDYTLNAGEKSLTMNENTEEQQSSEMILAGGNASEGAPVDPGMLTVDVTQPPSRGDLRSQSGRGGQGGNKIRIGTAENSVLVPEAMSRSASRGFLKSGGGDKNPMSRGGGGGKSAASNANGGIESFWSGMSDFQSLPTSDVQGEGSTHSDFGFVPAGPPDDISIGAAAIKRRLNSLMERPKTSLSQIDVAQSSKDVRARLHMDDDAKVPSVSRMLQMSNKVIKLAETMPREVARLGCDEESSLCSSVDDSRCQTSPVREFQKNLVRAMSSPGGKRLRNMAKNKKRKLARRDARPLTSVTLGGGGSTRKSEGTNVYIRYPGVEPLVTPISMTGSKGGLGGPGRKKILKAKTKSSYYNSSIVADIGTMYDDSKIGRYDSFGRPLSPLKGLSLEQLEEQRRRLLAEAEARRRAAELEAERLRLLEEERLKRLQEEEAARRRAEEEERRRLMEEKLRLEEEYKRKREEAERLRKEELARLEAERLAREAAEREAREREEAARRAREAAAAKRRAEEEARKAAILAEKKARQAAATKVQNSYRSKMAWRLFLFKKKKKEERDQHNASVMFQKVQRGKKARERVAIMREEKKQVDEKKGATMMQKVQRGRKARKLYALKLFEKQHKEEVKASVVLQSKIRQREAKREVARVREDKRKRKKEELAREAKERRRMGKCDFDADKVGWDLGQDRWGLLGRPLTYAELQQQEMVIRSRGKVVEKNLARAGGKFHHGDMTFKHNSWYGRNIEFDPAVVEGRVEGGTGVDLAEGEEREENVEDEVPKVLKDAHLRVPSDLSMLYDLVKNYDHKEWPPVWLTDIWDWGQHMEKVEKRIGIGEKRVKVEKKRIAEYVSGKIVQEIERKEGSSYGNNVDEMSYYSNTKYPIIPLMGESNRVVVGVAKGEFAYLQVPVIEKNCTVTVKVADWREDGTEQRNSCNFDLYLSENRLPTYFTYGWKVTKLPRRVVLFPHDRPVMSKSDDGLGNLFIGVFSESGGKCLVDVKVVEDKIVDSDAMKVVGEKVEFLRMLSEKNVGQLVAKFSEISSLTEKTVKRNIADREEMRTTGSIKTHESLLTLLEDAADGDDEKQQNKEEGSGSIVAEFEDKKKHEAERSRREVAVTGLVGVYTDGMRVNAVDLDDESTGISKRSDKDGDYYVVPEDISRGKVVSEEKKEDLDLSRDNIDLFSFDDILMESARRRVKVERKHKKTRVIERDSDGDDSSVESAGSALVGVGGVENRDHGNILLDGLDRTFQMWTGLSLDEPRSRPPSSQHKGKGKMASIGYSLSRQKNIENAYKKKKDRRLE